MSRTNLAGWTACAALVLTSSGVLGQTPIGKGFAIAVPPNFTLKPLQGIDTIVGEVVGADGVVISYEIGPVTQKGQPVVGGAFADQAAGLPEGQRAWLKEQTVGGQKFSIAYGEDSHLFVSAATETHGVNFSAVAKTPAEVTDVLLVALSLTTSK